MWSFLSTAAVYNQGDFLQSAAESIKTAALKFKAAVVFIFGDEKWLPSSDFFSFLPLGRCNQHYVVGKTYYEPEWKEPAYPVISQESGLCVLRLAHLLTVIFSCVMSTRTSVLHLGQYSGKLSTTVSSHTLVRVLLPQMGHRIHLAFPWSLFIYCPFLCN